MTTRADALTRYMALPDPDRTVLDWWIDHLIIRSDRRRVINKHVFEADTRYHVYVDNATFNAAMCAHGYTARPPGGDYDDVVSFAARLMHREGFTAWPLIGWHAEFADLVAATDTPEAWEAKLAWFPRLCASPRKERSFAT